MKTPSSPTPIWLKWLLRSFGIILILGSLYLTAVVVIAFIDVFHVFLGPKGHTVSDKQWLGIFGALLGRLVGQILLLLLGIWLWRWPRKKPNEKAEISRPAPVPAMLPGAPSFSTAARNKRWSSCNILHAAAEAHHLWQFDAKGGGFVLGREHRGPSLPARVVAKSWNSLWQPKLNVAWLPPEDVFLRVVELPKSNFDETLAMVELQLEKLSPMPVTQIVWTMHVLSQPAGGEATAGNLQTVIVVIAARNAVEEFLGKLEGWGFLADRLEAPFLDQLETAGPSRQPAAPQLHEDGGEAEADAWIYPLLLGSQKAALVAWWCGGALRNLSFVTLPPEGDRAAEIKKQLALLAWSGELEGWLTAPPKWHLVADPVNAAEWDNALREGLDEPVQVSPPLPPADLAGRTAQRAATTSERANLLPAEFATRYHQQFVDRLWLRGLMATGVLYAVGVAIYFCAVGFLTFKTQKVERDVAAISGNYNNAIQLKARYGVLKERQELKYAALDCWKVVAEQLPEGLVLQRFSFADGSKLSLNGTCMADQISLITEKDGFYDNVRKAKLNGQPMFNPNPNSGEQLTYRTTGDKVTWNFGLEMQHMEAEPR
jgi:hypothetical protein